MDAELTPGAFSPGLLLDIRQQLEAAAAAMDATLRQGASAPTIGRHGWTAAGFYAATGSLILGGRESHPLLLEAAASALAHLVMQQTAAGKAFTPGAIYATNDPRSDAAGVEDLILTAPVVRGGSLVCFVALTASHQALGRGSLAPMESLREEGVVLPWTRVDRTDGPEEPILSLLAANVLAPTAFLEDLAVQRKALGHGLAVAGQLADEQRGDVLVAAWDALAAGGRRALEKVLGKVEAKELRGRVGPFIVRIRRNGDGFSIALDRPEVGAGLPPPALARAAVRAGLREALAAEAPAVSRLGGWADALLAEIPWEFPSGTPVGLARFLGAQAIAEATLAALAAEFPHLTHTPDGGCPLVDLRGERADKSRYRLRLRLGAGLGASVFGDGMSHAAPAFSPQCLGAVEELEREAPLRVLRLELLPDSAGPGQYRGGLGARLELELLEGRAEIDVLLPGRAAGLGGGMRGRRGRLVLTAPDEGVREVEGPRQATFTLRAGHRLLLESPGGGGWGVPFQRALMRVEEDLARGLVSPDQSRTRYGVVVQPGRLERDDHLTYRLRHYLLGMLTAEDIIAGEEMLDE